MCCQEPVVTTPSGHKLDSPAAIVRYGKSGKVLSSNNFIALSDLS